MKFAGQMTGFLLGVVTLMVNSTIIMAQDATPEEANLTSKQLVTLYFDRWKNEGSSFFDLLDEDAEWIVVGRSPVSGTYHGKTDFMENAVKPILKKTNHAVNTGIDKPYG